MSIFLVFLPAALLSLLMEREPRPPKPKFYRRPGGREFHLGRSIEI